MNDSQRDRLRALAASHEAEVTRDRAEQLAARALTRGHDAVRRARRVVIALVGTAVLVPVMTAVGVLADPSVPGEILYPVDRAYESAASLIGIDTSRSEERLGEALTLLDRGQTVEAAELIEVAIVEVSKETGVDGELTELIAAPEPASATAASTPEEAAGVGTNVLMTDAAEELRLATEALLHSVRDVKEAQATGADDGVLTNELIAVAAGAVDAARTVIEGSDDDGEVVVDTTLPAEITTTTVPAEEPTDTTIPSETTTTTLGEGSTTTIPPDDGGGSEEEPGPIILPPQH